MFGSQNTNSSSGTGGGLLNKLEGLATGNTGGTHSAQPNTSSSGGGLMNKLSGLAGGNHGATGNSAGGYGNTQAKMDPLDKAVAFVEGRVGGNKQANTPTGRAKTEKISDAVRMGYKKVTGSNIPIKDT